MNDDPTASVPDLVAESKRLQDRSKDLRAESEDAQAIAKDVIAEGMEATTRAAASPGGTDPDDAPP